MRIRLEHGALELDERAPVVSAAIGGAGEQAAAVARGRPRWRRQRRPARPRGRSAPGREVRRARWRSGRGSGGEPVGEVSVRRGGRAAPRLAGVATTRGRSARGAGCARPQTHRLQASREAAADRERHQSRSRRRQRRRRRRRRRPRRLRGRDAVPSDVADALASDRGARRGSPTRQARRLRRSGRSRRAGTTSKTSPSPTRRSSSTSLRIAAASRVRSPPRPCCLIRLALLDRRMKGDRDRLRRL